MSTSEAVRAELLRLRGARRLLGIGVIAIVASLATSAPVALLVGALAPSAVEATVVTVHRGSAAQIAVAVAVGVLVGGDHRHGTATLAWLQLGGRRRLLVVGMVQAAVAAGLALGSAAIALVVVSATTRSPLADVAVVLVVHVVLTVVWSAWVVCLATLTGSTLATVGLGLAVPLALEPAVSGVLAATGAGASSRLLPTTALRMLGEVAASGERVVLAPQAPSDAWIVAVVVVAWTGALVALAWRRAARAP